tara:strand:- start:185 stop:430 length:246 start_codon:yes stop_codon:yes gene_type:complete
MNNQIEMKLKNGTTEYMTHEEFSRWACLVEGIQAVDQKLVAANVPDKNTKWVKPLAFEKYIQERFHSMLSDVRVEHRLGKI